MDIDINGVYTKVIILTIFIDWPGKSGTIFLDQF